GRSLDLRFRGPYEPLVHEDAPSAVRLEGREQAEARSGLRRRGDDIDLIARAAALDPNRQKAVGLAVRHLGQGHGWRVDAPLDLGDQAFFPLQSPQLPE